MLKVLRKQFIWLLVFIPFVIFAQDAPKEAVEVDLPTQIANLTKANDLLRIGLDTFWVLLCGMLVFFMNAGFALVESGFARSKNTVNILAKNFVVFALSTIAFWVIGWGIMFGDGNSFIGTQGLFFVKGVDNSPAVGDAYKGVYSSINWTSIPLTAKFFFQLVFAGTAATIVSGAVAERIKFSSFVVFSLILVAFMYPVTGHWIWGGGFLGSMDFRDFAGSTVVHSVGGWAALAGAIVLGPRLGKYLPNGQLKPIMGHNMTSAALGTLILWLGWFGFNPGSTMAVGDGSAIAHILLTTNIAAATGAIGATIASLILIKKPDISMILNGTLAGLVAITAPCAFVTVESGAIIGLIGGMLVVVSVLFFDKIKIDDPVGATSVHLVNGIWGTLAVGIFYNVDIATAVAGVETKLTSGQQFLVQLEGVLAVGAFTFVVSMIVWYVLKIWGIRVGEAEEIEGLDVGEHGNEAYPDFQIKIHS
ncbi:MAG: ammonium transporter [Leptospiraceae bacterium]|nr:ammonium transporter [Leptospiraceae bacterium]MCP5512975.1 ammonium transporter [Leptospiraceae bacterium]